MKSKKYVITWGDRLKSYKVEEIGEDFIPKTFNRQLVDEAERIERGITDNLVRLSVGIEAQKDLQEDLEKALS